MTTQRKKTTRNMAKVGSFVPRPPYRPAVKQPYVAPTFVGNPFDAAAVASHHDAVAAAPWLAGMATPSNPAPPSARLRVLCVIPDVEVDTKVLDKIDDLRDAEDVTDEYSYDVVFVDAEASYRSTLVAALGSRCVVVSSRPSKYQIPATVSALLRRIGDEVAFRRLQTTMPWAPPLPTLPAPSLDDAAVDALVTA